MKKQNLTKEQESALQEAKKTLGRSWKAELRECWMNSRYPEKLLDVSATLQYLRNCSYFGAAGLMRYKG